MYAFTQSPFAGFSLSLEGTLLLALAGNSIESEGVEALEPGFFSRGRWPPLFGRVGVLYFYPIFCGFPGTPPPPLE